MTGPSVPVGEGAGAVSRWLPVRVMQLWLSPGRTWAAIAAEPASVGALYVGVIMPLSALIPLTMILRVAASSGPVGSSIEQWLLMYVMELPALYGVAMVISRWGPKYGGRAGMVPSLKVVAYAGSPYWVLVGFLMGIQPSPSPFWAMIGFGGVCYGVYLLAVGLRVVVGADRQVGRYTVLVCASSLLILCVAEGVTASALASPGSTPNFRREAIVAIVSRDTKVGVHCIAEKTVCGGNNRQQHDHAMNENGSPHLSTRAAMRHLRVEIALSTMSVTG